MQSVPFVNRALLGIAVAALAFAGTAQSAAAQPASGGMMIRVSVVESINPIAVIRPPDGIRVVTDAFGSRGQLRFGIESDMPVEVSIRAVDGSVLPGSAALASRIRLVGSATVPRGGPATPGRAFNSGANEIGLDFNWSDFGNATRGTLELPATEVRATARRGDAEVTVIAYLPAVSLNVPPGAATTVAAAETPGVADRSAAPRAPSLHFARQRRVPRA